MSKATPCTICGKTAYPLESLGVGDKTYHKLCFRCHECKNPLNQKTYKTVGGNIYCFTHTPVDRSTAINSVSNQSAMNAPKKAKETAGQVARAPSEAGTPKIGLDSFATKAALTAPKAAKIEAGIHKGASETAPKPTEVVNQGASGAHDGAAPVGAAETSHE